MRPDEHGKSFRGVARRGHRDVEIQAIQIRRDSWRLRQRLLDKESCFIVETVGRREGGWSAVMLSTLNRPSLLPWQHLEI